MKTKPSDFTNLPASSTLKEFNAEKIARNIMAILERVGNEFRPLTWGEYKEERQRDGNFTNREKQFFDKAIEHCQSPETAKRFSPRWAD